MSKMVNFRFLLEAGGGCGSCCCEEQAEPEAGVEDEEWCFRWGVHGSPARRRRKTVLSGSHLRYSPSSMCVPSDSSTNRTASLVLQPSFSRPDIMTQTPTISTDTSSTSSTVRHQFQMDPDPFSVHPCHSWRIPNDWIFFLGAVSLGTFWPHARPSYP